MANEVLVEKSSYILKIRLNRPEVHNAFNPDVIRTLTELFAKDAREPHVRAVYLSGMGPSFCAGADLNWMKSMANASKQENADDADALFELFAQAATCPTPIVGRLHGNVMGGGLGLAAICDIAVAEADTKFCFSEVRLGIAPAVISSFVLRKMSHATAREYMISGQVFSAEVALRAGLVQFVGRELEMNNYLDKVLSAFGRTGPEAVRRTKRLIDEILASPPERVRELSVETIAALRVGDEGQEGIRAFLEKRKPRWVIEDAEKN